MGQLGHDAPLLGGLDPAKVRKWLGEEIEVNTLAGRAMGRSLVSHGSDPDTVAEWARQLVAGAYEAAMAAAKAAP